MQQWYNATKLLAMQLTQRKWIQEMEGNWEFKTQAWIKLFLKLMRPIRFSFSINICTDLSGGGRRGEYGTIKAKKSTANYNLLHIALP